MIMKLKNCILLSSLSMTCGKLAVFFYGTLVSSTNKTDRNDITEILLKVALNTINQPNLSRFCTGTLIENCRTKPVLWTPTPQLYVERSRALDERLSDWCCSVSMV